MIEGAQNLPYVELRHASTAPPPLNRAAQTGVGRDHSSLAVHQVE
jgi:hypothetical protein